MYSLDRIEDGEIAVLIDKNGCKTDVHLSKLKGTVRIGAIYTLSENHYIYNEKETEHQKKRANDIFAKIKKKAKKQ